MLLVVTGHKDINGLTNKRHDVHLHKRKDSRKIHYRTDIEKIYFNIQLMVNLLKNLDHLNKQKNLLESHKVILYNVVLVKLDDQLVGFYGVTKNQIL